MSDSIELRLRRDVPLRDQCGHGKLWAEDCTECEIVSLTDYLYGSGNMIKRIERDKARLERLLRERDKGSAR